MFSKTAKLISTFSVYWASFFFFAIGSWINSTFGKPSFEQVLFHLQFGSEGLIDAPKRLIWEFIIQCALYSLLAALCLICSQILVSRVEKHGYKDFTNTIIKAIISIIHKTSLFITYWTNPWARRALPYFLLIISACFMLTKLSFWDYVKEEKYANYIDSHYVYPETINGPLQPRNLILIYAESLETAYSDKSLFGRDLLSDIDQSTSGWESFEDFSQTFGTGWTMGGIVATQCGVPLRPFNKFDKDVIWGRINGNSLGEKTDQFLPGIKCLGDVLEEAGYTSVFLGGAELRFAGKGKFLSQHGYQEVIGKAEWESAGERELGEWGLHDDRLFNHAKLKLDELQAVKAPFNLTILTVDMHHPEGFINQTCREDGVEDFAGIVECSSRLASDFIRYIFSKGYNRNTDIVVIGDHLSMKNSVEDLLVQRKPYRTIYNKFYSSRPLTKNREKLYPFSIFPTVLHMLGFDFPQNRLALGASGFGELDPAYKLKDEAALGDKLNSKSEIYRKFWEGN